MWAAMPSGDTAGGEALQQSLSQSASSSHDYGLKAQVSKAGGLQRMLSAGG